ncbi:unnamed protein product [Fraxinus pennsylvanica]|uniref:Uncharacterized protein n=1 Tax=Fraxinus pennsylvanica TaxID=56036 RepID=A0AAD2A018_9LAMI|nr:unnamed protein product [Fraxinus pennsylvanica]
MAEEGRVHPDCRNASNPYHECSEYYFKIIAETKKKMNKNDTGMQVVSDSGEANAVAIVDQEENHERDGKGGDSEVAAGIDGEDDTGKDLKNLTGRQKIIGRLLDANGLNMSKAYMLDTQDMAESKYKKWEKEPTPTGWDGMNYYCFIVVMFLTCVRSSY